MFKTYFLSFSIFFSCLGFSQVDSSFYKVYYFENSEQKSSEGFIIDGKPDAYWKTYYNTGILKSEGNRKNFLLDSIWKFYNEDGFITTEITYKENKKTGPYKIYADSGVLHQVYYLIDDKKTGEFIEYYPSGEIKKKGGFKNDTIQETLLEFAEDDGRVIKLTTFKEGYIETEEYINNKDLDGNKQGIWKEFHENGKLKKEANYRDNKINGIVKEFTKEGELVVFEKFKDGVEDIEAEEVEFVQLYKEYYPDGTVKLEGGQLNGKKNGFFRTYNEKGEFIQTLIYKNDIKIAEGIIDTALQYQGEWTFYFESGKLKGKGKYVDNLKVGEWVYYYENGVLEQKGTYKKGKPINDWNWYHPNEKLKRNEFYINGLIEGESIEYDSTSVVVSKGNYIAGRREGDWYLKVGDHKEEGEYLDGDKHGVWVYTYDNNQTAFKGEFRLGIPIGKHKWYHANGKTKLEGKYEAGMKQGDWVRYNSSGAETIKITYKNDIEIKIDGLKYESPKLLD